MGKALTPKKERFVEEYLIDLNATQAAIRAGYSEKTARQAAARLLSDVNIQKATAEAKQARSERTQITQDEVLREALRIARSDIRNVLSPLGNLKNPQDWDDDTAASVASIEVVTRKVGYGDDAETEYVHKIRTWDKNAALEKLFKHLGLYEKDNEQGKPEVNVSPIVTLMDAVDGKTRSK